MYPQENNSQQCTFQAEDYKQGLNVFLFSFMRCFSLIMKNIMPCGLSKQEAPQKVVMLTFFHIKDSRN